jgi:uncharacterized membrane protein (DUF2068 family)
MSVDTTTSGVKRRASQERRVQERRALGRQERERDGERHNLGVADARWLRLIGLFKLSKAVFFGVLGAGALKLVHYDIGDLAQRLLDATHQALHIDPEGRIVTALLDKADTISNHHVRQAGMLSAGYACLCLVEAYGLLKRKTWAEYFTIIITASALPWEMYEMHEHFTWFKVAFMVANVLVLVYLVLFVRKMKRCFEGK